MNKNDYRRALIMLRSLRSGISGYVRLERRTLMGTLHFTINGVQDSCRLYAVLLYRQGGAWHGVRAGELAAPRYGQTGLVWKFDPRNIEKRSLEQYDLTAVVEITSGVCDLVLCGNINGSVEADWSEIREAACRVFTPVRIAGSPVSPIDERDAASDSLPKEEENFSTPDGQSGANLLYEEEKTYPDDEKHPGKNPVSSETHSSAAETEPCGIDTPADMLPGMHEGIVMDDMDTPAAEPPRSESDAEDDELDIPAGESGCSCESSENDAVALGSFEPDELDTPAVDFPVETPPPAETESENGFTSAGDMLELSDKDAPWPECIAPLKELFFTSRPLAPFEAEGYVFISAPLPEDSGMKNCFVGLYCEEGVPSRVCYALPAQYTPEPPAGLEGYVWRDGISGGCWAICEAIQPD